MGSFSMLRKHHVNTTCRTELAFDVLEREGRADFNELL